MQSTFGLSYLSKQGNKPKTDEYVSSLLYINSAIAFVDSVAQSIMYWVHSYQ